MKTASRLLVFGLIASTARPADALLTNQCWIDANQVWFVSTNPLAKGIEVPVWTFNAGSCIDDEGFLVDASLTTATGIALANLEQGIQRAIAIWNEESGAGLKFRYMGVKNVCYETGAVIVRGTSRCRAAPALAWPIRGGTPIRYQGGHIEFARFNGSSGCSNPITWTTAPVLGGTSKAFVAYLVHELGHQVFNIGDVGEDPPGGNCEFAGPTTMSHVSLPLQTLTNWDREIVQRRYPARSNYARFFKSVMLSATTWSVSANVKGDWAPNYKRALFRMGSLTNKVSTRLLGWVYGGNTIQDGGTGRLDFSQYAWGGMPNWGSIAVTGPGVIGKPVAVASQWNGGTKLLIAYMKLSSDTVCGIQPPDPNHNEHACSIYETDEATICYRTSTNGGTVWGSETCVFTPGDPFGRQEKTNAYGLVATYDSYTNRFVVGWTKSNWSLRILTINASTGASVLNLLTLQSPHAPGIACSGLSGDCIIAYQTADTGGTLNWTNITVSSGGGVTTGSTSSQFMLLVDTPSVVFDYDSFVYRMVITQRSAAAYSYKLVGGSWVGTGDVINDDSKFISTAVITTRPWSSYVSRPYSWFTRYW